MALDADYWENLFFTYCFIMSRPEKEFYKSTHCKVLKMMELYFKSASGKAPQQKTRTVTSMRDFLAG